MTNQVQILNPQVTIIADVKTNENFQYISCAAGYQNVPELWNLSYTIESGKLYYKGELQDFFGYNYHDDAPNELGAIVNSLSNITINGAEESDYFATQQYPINLGYWFSKREAAKPAKRLLDATLQANKESKWEAMLAEQKGPKEKEYTVMVTVDVSDGDYVSRVSNNVRESRVELLKSIIPELEDLAKKQALVDWNEYGKNIEKIRATYGISSPEAEALRLLMPDEDRIYFHSVKEVKIVEVKESLFDWQKTYTEAAKNK